MIPTNNKNLASFFKSLAQLMEDDIGPTNNNGVSINLEEFQDGTTSVDILKNHMVKMTERDTKKMQPKPNRKPQKSTKRTMGHEERFPSWFSEVKCSDQNGNQVFFEDVTKMSITV